MKRCSRCQAVYTDEVRWCPADGTPTEEVAPSPAALAAAANHIPEGAPTLHDMPAVGPGTSGWNETPPVQRASNPNATMIGAPSPLPRVPSSPPSDKPVGDTLRGATSPVPSSPAPYAPNATMIGPQSSTQTPAFAPNGPPSSTQPTPPPAFASNATMIGPQSSTQAPPPVAPNGPQASANPTPPSTNGPQPPVTAHTPNGPQASAQTTTPLNATMIGGVSPFAPRGPALSPELAKLASTIPSGPTNAPSPVDAGVHGPSTIQGSPEVRAPAPLSTPSTVPGALLPPVLSPLLSTFTGTTSEPPRTPHGSSTSPADLGPQGNTFMGAPSPVPRAPAPPMSPPSTVPGALVPPIHAPLLSTFTGTTSDPPRTPHGSTTTPAELAAASLTSTPISPAAHTPGPVSQGWDIPDPPAGAAEGLRPNTTLQGFAPSPEVLRAIQEQRAKLVAQQAGETQPLAAPEIAAEAYIPSGAAPAESYASMAVAHSTAMTAVGSATDPSMPAPPIPLNSTLPALSPLPMQPAVVLMASQQSALSQAPLPSVSMPHAVAPAPAEAVVVSQSMTMAAAQLPSTAKPPTASLLEAPPFQAAAAAAAARPSAGETDKHRAVGGNRTLWIVFAVIAVAMIGATIAILVTR
jgi:hypothetical protein